MSKYLIPWAVIALLGFGTGCSSPEEKAAGYISSAQALFGENNLDKAEIEYKNALQINQNLPDAWYGLARIHERKQQWKQAYAALSRIREITPNHVEGRIMLAQMVLASNQIDQALEDAQQILEMAPEEARAHSLMAAVQFRLGNNERALESVTRSLVLNPGNSEAMLVKARLSIAAKDYKDAIKTLDEAIEAEPQNASFYLMKIQAYAEQGDQDGVEKVYIALIENFPENISFKRALIRRYVDLKKFDEAENLLERIIRDKPDFFEAKQSLVEFKSRYRSVDDAITLIKSYIDTDQDKSRFLFMLGKLYESQKSYDEATKIYQQVVEAEGLQQNGLEARNQLALIHARLGENDEARALINEVLENDKSNENALLLRAGFKIGVQEFDNAIIDLRTVLRDNPNSLRALALIGQAYSLSGSTELAIESYRKAFDASPQNPTVANQLAGIYIRDRNPSQANEILTRSIEAGNQSIEAIKLLTQVKLMLNEWDFAESLAQQLKGVEGQEAVSQQVLGIVYQGREQQDESIDAFKQAHELAPDAAQPVVALVQSYIKNDRIQEARQFLENLVAENDNNITAQMLLGRLSLLENDLPSAIGYFEAIVRIDPKLDIGYRSLAAIYNRENRPVDAERILLQGMAENPDSAAMAMNLASTYERVRKFDKAIEIYEGLLQKNPKLIIAKNNLASLLSDYRTDPASRDRARQMALEFRNSEMHQFRDTYAWAAVQAGVNLEEAITILEGVVREAGETGVYHYHLGEALRKAGETEKAKQHLDKAVGLEPEGSPIGTRARESLLLVSQ